MLAARNCVILYCTLGLGFLVLALLCSKSQNWLNIKLFVFFTDWICALFCQWCHGTVHIQRCQWTCRSTLLTSQLPLIILLILVNESYCRCLHLFHRCPEKRNKEDAFKFPCQSKVGNIRTIKKGEEHTKSTLTYLKIYSPLHWSIHLSVRARSCEDDHQLDGCVAHSCYTGESTYTICQVVFLFYSLSLTKTAGAYLNCNKR